MKQRPASFSRAAISRTGRALGAALLIIVAGAAAYLSFAPPSSSTLPQCSGAPSPTSSSSTIQIGFLTELTGPGESNGYAARIGAELAVNETNSAGGVDGRQISLVVQDDSTIPQTATQLASSLDSQGVLAITGPTDPNDANAIRAYAEACGVPFVESTVQSAALAAPGSKWTAVLEPDPVQMGAALAKYVSQVVPGPRIALLTQNAPTPNEMSVGVRWFANTYKNASVVFDQTFSNPQFPWATPAAAAKFSGANAVVVSWLPTIGFSQGNVIAALVSAGFSQRQIFVVFATDQVSDLGSNATGIRGTTLFDAAMTGNANVSAFVNRVEPYIKGQSNPYIAYCGVCPTEVGPNYYYAYLGMKLMISALQASLSGGQALTRMGFMASVKQASVQDFSGNTIAFDANGSSSGRYYLVAVGQSNADASTYALELVKSAGFGQGVVPSYALSRQA